MNSAALSPADAPHYQVVYDAASSTHLMLLAALTIGVVIAGAAFVHFFQQERNRIEGRRQVVMAAFVASVLLIMVSGIMFDEYWMGAALRSGKYDVVEGVVTNFTPSNGHVDESWEVESGGSIHRFHYLPASFTPGFRKTQMDGGPVRAGLRVRIATVDGHIARLEIAN